MRRAILMLHRRSNTAMAWRNLLIGFALIVAGSCPMAAAAALSASAYPRSADNIGLGLDRLRWGMTSEEVRLAYPELQFTAANGDMYGRASEPGGAWGPVALSAENYRQGGCTFGLYLTFYHARLKTVGAHSTNTGAALRDCRRQVRSDLTALYGPPEGGYPHFPGPVTIASFDVPAFAGPLNPPPGPRPLSIGFADANDISGFEAAMHDDTRNFCQRITIEFLPDASGSGATTPMLAPRLKPDLGCDYPPISLRLQEQGKVVLDVHVLADGTVDKADVAISDSHPRLNAAAADVLQNKVQFIPAMKDGKQVEVSRQIAVTFKLIRPIRGAE